MPDVGDQNVIVTGGNRGIGREIVARFARDGATVGLLGRREEAVEEACQELAEDPEVTGEVDPVVADVADPEAVREAVGEWVEEHEEVHTLVNNAGTRRDGLLLRMRQDDWHDVVDVNLHGTFYCTHAVVRSMMRNEWGRLIMISSVSGLRGNPGQANYAASKAGVIGFTKSVARELAPRNITANVIAPGFMETDLTGDLTEEQEQRLIEVTPMGRPGELRDVADCVRFLASERAGYITGEVIRVDGGMAM